MKHNHVVHIVSKVLHYYLLVSSAMFRDIVTHPHDFPCNPYLIFSHNGNGGMAQWYCIGLDNSMVSTNIVTVCWAQLVLGWVTICRQVPVNNLGMNAAT